MNCLLEGPPLISGLSFGLDAHFRTQRLSQYVHKKIIYPRQTAFHKISPQISDPANKYTMSPADKTQIEKIPDPKNKSKMSPTDNEHIDDELVTNSGNEKV